MKIDVSTGLLICVVILMGPMMVLGQSEDMLPPTLAAFSFVPTTIDVATSSQNVAFTLRITDNLSGFSNTYVWLISPSGQQRHTLYLTHSHRTSGDTKDGTYQRSLTFQPHSEAGAWLVEKIQLEDSAGNWMQMLPADLVASGFSTQLTVTGGPDLAAPELDEFDFGPKSIDVSSSFVDVSFALTITDSVSGFSGADVYLRSPSGGQSQRLHIAPVHCTSGDVHSGTFERDLTIPQYSEAGTWSVEEIELKDAVGNRTDITTAQLVAKGFVTELEVASEPDDTSAPALAEFAFQPMSINVDSSSKEVTFTLTATDEPSGFYRAYLWLVSPSGRQKRELHIGLSYCTSGDAYSGTYERALTIPQYSETGKWFVERLQTRDAVGNWINLNTENLRDLGFPVCLYVGENQNPAAVAGPDKTGIVGETLSFDGSASYDPDGTIVNFQWDFGDGSSSEQGGVVTHTYTNAGTYVVTLTVTDDKGAFSTDLLNAIILSPKEAAEAIVDEIEDLGLSKGLENSLMSKLDNVIKSLADGQSSTAINQLNALINQLNAQNGKRIPKDDADRIKADIQTLIEAIQG